MKNKIIFTALTICFFLFNVSFSEIIKFESPTINIDDNGKKITAKNGVIGLTKALSVEWGKYNITVNAISPGPIKTPRTKWFLDQDPKNEKLMISRTPAGRLGEVTDVSNAAKFLISEKSSFVTGQNIIVDGGWLPSAWFGNYKSRK